MKYGIALLVFALGVMACNDDYLSIDPIGQTTDEEFIGSKDKAQEVLNSAYDALTYDKFLAGHCQFLSEIMADNIDGQYLSNNDWRAHYTWTTDIFLGTTFDLMRDGYRSISNANYLIDKLNEVPVPDLDAATKTRMIAEAKFVRGLAHFHLVRMFAQPYGFTADNSHMGIVLRSKFGRDLLPRASVKEVYDLILSDLQEAAANLPTENGNYATAWAAKGMLAKVYFQMNDFQNAAEQANDVLENGGFALDTSVVARFRVGPSTERVFALVGNDFDNDNPGKRFRDNFKVDPSRKAADAYISTNMYGVASTEASDLRLKNWYQALDGPVKLYTFHKFPTLRDEGPVQVVLVGLAELKLIRAESLAELNQNLDVAVQDLEDIIRRAGLVPNIITEANAIIDKARAQRRLEMVGEGERLHELKRQALAGNSSLRIRGIAPWDCAGAVCQFPAGELQANPAVEPNPTGGCQ